MLIIPQNRYALISIDTLNWKDSFPYHPRTELQLSHSSRSLHLLYSVEEEYIKADCLKDKDPVWEDSCVEMFIAFGDERAYYNIEANSRGSLYMCKGEDREHREFLSEEKYASVKRTAKAGGEEGRWSLSLDIPSEVFDLKSFSGTRARANFYKCLGSRHYLSWAPVLTPKPDFHRPEFFKEIAFE